MILGDSRWWQDATIGITWHHLNNNQLLPMMRIFANSGLFQISWVLSLLLAAQHASAQLTVEDETFITEFMEMYDLPGVSIAVVDDYELSYAKAFGVKNSETGEKVTEETAFQAASLSKSLTAVMMLRSAEKGLIDLDGSVNRYLKGWQLQAYKDDPAQIPTIRQLLSHTGGTNLSGFWGYHSTKKLPSMDMILNGNGHTHIWEPKIKMKYPTNDGWHYSGGGYCLVQKAISDQRQESFAVLMQTEVFEPCDMQASFFSIDLSDAQKARISSGHKKNGKPVKSEYHHYPQMAAAGLWATPTDLAKFLIQVIRSAQSSSEASFLTEKSIQELIDRPLLQNGQRSSYGLGFMLNVDPDNGEVKIIHHSGRNHGFACKMYANLQTGKAIVIMYNRHKIATWPIGDRIKERIGF